MADSGEVRDDVKVPGKNSTVHNMICMENYVHSTLALQRISIIIVLMHSAIAYTVCSEQQNMTLS